MDIGTDRREQMVPFGEKLRMLREREGMSREDLAKRSDVSRQTVARWETEDAYPDTGLVVRLARIFSVPVEELLSETAPVSARYRQEGDYTPSESVEGYLTYRQKWAWRVALAGALVLGGVMFPFLSWEWGILAYLAALAAAVCLLLSAGLLEKPLPGFRRGTFQLEETVRKSLAARYARRKKRADWLAILGVVLIANGLLLLPLLAGENTDIVMLLGTVQAGIGAFLCIRMWSMVHSFRRLLE